MNSAKINILKPSLNSVLIIIKSYWTIRWTND